jgi:CHASE3 domain sensor protein
VSREEYDNVCKLLDQKNTEHGRLSKIVEENQLEMFKLKEIIDAQRDTQQSSIQDRIEQDEELTNEIDSLQKGVH